MRSFRYVVADVFTDTPLEGNQLAVFTDARDLDEVTMQALALELGLSETVFVLPAREGGTVRIRIFTPRNESPFAGHPCLGTAFVLGAPLQLGTIALETGSGIVPVELERDPSGRIVFGRMTQPVPTVAPYERAEEMMAALGVESSQLPVEVYDNGVRHAYVVLPSKEDVAGLRPDSNALLELDLVGALAAAGERHGLEGADVLAPRRRRRGRGDRVGGRPARVPSRPPRPRPVGRGDRDRAGNGDRPALDPLRTCDRLGRRDRVGRGRWVGRHGRARSSSSNYASATAVMSGSSGASEQNLPPFRDM